MYILHITHATLLDANNSICEGLVLSKEMYMVQSYPKININILPG